MTTPTTPIWAVGFFDRSFIDVACAVERLGLEAPEGLELALESFR
ncbi:MAG: hypothetical protein ABGX04_12505 [Myxococcales bacterium]